MTVVRKKENFRRWAREGRAPAPGTGRGTGATSPAHGTHPCALRASPTFCMYGSKNTPDFRTRRAGEQSAGTTQQLGAAPPPRRPDSGRLSGHLPAPPPAPQGHKGRPHSSQRGSHPHLRHCPCWWSLRVLCVDEPKTVSVETPLYERCERDLRPASQSRASAFHISQRQGRNSMMRACLPQGLRGRSKFLQLGVPSFI